jgi:hypothetical protein
MNVVRQSTYWLITPALLLAFSSCGKGHCPDCPQPSEPDPAQPSPSLSDCLNMDAPIPGFDPGGNGDDPLGVGFWHTSTSGKPVFVRVDLFDARRATRAGQPISHVEVRSHALTGVDAKTGAGLGPAEWGGALLVGQLHCPNPRLTGQTHAVQVRIRTAPVYGLWAAYDLELMLEDGRTFEACGREPGDAAFPVAGYYNDRGDFIEDRSRFSFACTRHNVARCISKGYLDDSLSPDTVSLFKACVRMERADYCGNGYSYTKDGTLVDMWDSLGIVLDPHKSHPEVVITGRVHSTGKSGPESASAGPDREEWDFEAAWNEHGMVCYKRARYPQGAIPGKIPPPCLEPQAKPECESPEDAMKYATPEVPLLFNSSCMHHPCDVATEIHQQEPAGSDAPEERQARSSGAHRRH